ncbi:MAG: tetratricopeptide repeat protein [Reyranellales bacterium]|jgi:predicted O-linked N-acetylglucosamine transferase (SPINDLY family)
MVVLTKSAAAFQQAVAIYRQGRLEEAEALCRETLKTDARHVGALHLLGVIGLRRRRPADALQAFDRVLKLQPDTPELLNNRAMALYDVGRHDEALKSFDRALTLRPRYPEALNNRAGMLYALRRVGEAAETYARMLALSPDPQTLGALHRARMSACDWTDYDKTSAQIVAQVERDVPQGDTMSLTWFSFSAALQRRAAEIYARRYPRRPLSSAPRHAAKRLRVAYFALHFHDHPMAYMHVELFERLDRSKFEVIALSYGPDDKSPMRARLEKAFDRFIDISKAADLETAQLIQREQVDILVDLSGLTAGNRASILGYRPAPIQVNGQGFGMGAPFMDYVISDPVTAPDDLREAMYREKVVRLPDTWITTDTSQAIADETPSRAAEGLPETGFVFCCFGTHYRITPAVFDVWMRLLAQVPGSVLWLRHDTDDSRANLLEEAQARGIAADRLVFARRVELDVHLARHRLAGVFLDAFPCGVQTTASHALWAGLPLLTILGETFVSRTTASILRAAGLPELVVNSLADYEALALALARDPERLDALRRKLVANRATAPLFDGERYRRHVEQAYLQMMERQRSGQAPESFDVPVVP